MFLYVVIMTCKEFSVNFQWKETDKRTHSFAFLAVMWLTHQVIVVLFLLYLAFNFYVVKNTAAKPVINNK